MFKKNLILVVGIAILAIGCSSGGNEPSSSATTGSSTTGGTTGGTTGASGATTDGFASVQPIFNQNCVGCHGADHPKGGINLTSAESINKGGEDGPIVAAGDPDKSKLVDALRGRNGAMQMPKGKAPLSEDDIKKVEAWIKAGAKS